MHLRFLSFRFSLLVGCAAVTIIATTGPEAQQPEPVGAQSAQRVGQHPRADTLGIEARARALVTAMSQGRYVDAWQDFDQRTRASLPPDKLADIWRSITAQVGGLENVGESRVEELPPYTTVVIQATFERATLDSRITFTADSQVTGLHFVPAQSGTVSGSTTTGTAGSP